MTKEEIIKEIDRLESIKFLLDMKDHWEPSDYGASSSYNNRIKELKKQLEGME